MYVCAVLYKRYWRSLRKAGARPETGKFSEDMEHPFVSDVADGIYNTTLRKLREGNCHAFKALIHIV